MARRKKCDPQGPVEPGDLDGLLPLALRITAETGDSSEQEILSTLVQAFQEPGVEDRLKSLLDEEGVSPELRREYLRMIAGWRRSLGLSRAVTEVTAESSGKSSAPQRRSSS